LLARADEEGLTPEAYNVAALSRQRSARTPQDTAWFELLLTSSLLHYARDSKLGRVSPERSGNDVALPPKIFDAGLETESALSDGRLAHFLTQLQPPYAEYARLRVALAGMRALEKNGPWPVLDGVEKIAIEENEPRLADLRSRLAVESPDLLQDKSLEALRAALLRYQSTNGLATDGVAGRKTIAALNIPVTERVATITANMERWRWLPAPPPRYIMVNVADASLSVIENGREVLASRIIAGKKSTPTPMFATTVTAVTVNPYWNVPVSIARNEIWPKVRRDPAYLSKHHMVVENGQIRQLPGDDNSLGLIKLEMPNVFGTYLHDTPSRKLFAADERFLSHGCMRVDRIQPLAAYVLTGDAEKGLPRIEAAIKERTNKTIRIENPIPVFVVYWTAIAEKNGMVGFRSDVYGRDRTLLAALAGRPGYTPVTMNGQCISSAG